MPGFPYTVFSSFFFPSLSHFSACCWWQLKCILRQARVIIQQIWITPSTIPFRRDGDSWPLGDENRQRCEFSKDFETTTNNTTHNVRKPLVIQYIGAWAAAARCVSCCLNLICFITVSTLMNFISQLFGSNAITIYAWLSKHWILAGAALLLKFTSPPSHKKYYQKSILTIFFTYSYLYIFSSTTDFLNWLS